MSDHNSDTGLETIWDRSDLQKPRCKFGEQGLCCQECFMGPCRINPSSEKKFRRGVCGATAETIVARNFARMIASGVAAHSDHGRQVAKTLLIAATSRDSGYSIKDVSKLKKVAQVLAVPFDGRSKEDIALEVAETVLEQFGRQEGEIPFIKLAPESRQAVWRKLGVVPRGIDREIVEMIHRTTMGVDQDYRNILVHAARTALADGWGGSMIATELQDILFGNPSPIRGEVNLGVLSENDVNIILHGH
ncbi:MAG: carbon monoxide dehydrogenase, partial [Dehalococcoidia bacterium]|nr:carbon monoxide dehydrogenase [Dehalococcoidia bacterium]